MNILVELLFASCLLLFLAVALVMIGVVGLAVRWVFQVWSGGGSHRPYDRDIEMKRPVGRNRPP
jgi:hypothetical protein